MDRRDADGFIPPSPASARPRMTRSVAPSDSSTRSRSSGRTLVEDALYRDVNLATNNFHIRPPWSYPEQISGLVNHVGQRRDSPGPSLEDIKGDRRLQSLEDGAAETDVERYFLSETDIFTRSDGMGSLKATYKTPLSSDVVPDVGSGIKVSNPVPDFIYGYNRIAFTDSEQAQLTAMDNKMVVNSQSLTYPFFFVEFEGDAPGSAGSLWVATNQCLGGSAACVKTAERLNHYLRQCQSDTVQPIDSSAFSIAMNGTSATLYVSWKHDDLQHYTARVDSFALQDPEHYVKFRKYVRNIIDWGSDRRLKEIRNALDILSTESRGSSHY